VVCSSEAVRAREQGRQHHTHTQSRQLSSKPKIHTPSLRSVITPQRGAPPAELGRPSRARGEVAPKPNPPDFVGVFVSHTATPAAASTNVKLAASLQRPQRCLAVTWAQPADKREPSAAAPIGDGYVRSAHVLARATRQTKILQFTTGARGKLLLQDEHSSIRPPAGTQKPRITNYYVSSAMPASTRSALLLRSAIRLTSQRIQPTLPSLRNS
jgi:hypothetical protein